MQPGDGGPAAGCGRDPAGGCDAFSPAPRGIRGAVQDSKVRRMACKVCGILTVVPARQRGAVADVVAGVTVATTSRRGRPDQGTSTVLNRSGRWIGAIFRVKTRTFPVGIPRVQTSAGTSRSRFQRPRSETGHLPTWNLPAPTRDAAFPTGSTLAPDRATHFPVQPRSTRVGELRFPVQPRRYPTRSLKDRTVKPVFLLLKLRARPLNPCAFVPTAADPT